MNTNDQTSSFNRRQFLEAAGFTMSIAAISGCRRAPVEIALPFAVQPEDVVPGRTTSYASTCAGCPAGCGLLVGVRDGRPLKMEGMPEHPLSAGGLCATGQALPLGLYDSHRLARPLADGNEVDWQTIDESVMNRIAQLESHSAVVFVTPTVTSPTLLATIKSFLSRFERGRHVIVDAVSSSAILDAHEQTHGVRLLPHYHFDNAQMIVSFGADFLGTWISPVEFAAKWATNRAPTPESPNMSCHIQLEGHVSLTGTNADRRYRVAPSEYASVLGHLATELGRRAGVALPKGTPGISPLSDADLHDLVERLWNARGSSLVVSDSQDVETQMLVNYVNHVLDNYGQTIDITRPSHQRQANDRDVETLFDDLIANRVGALFVAGTDLTHNLPRHADLVEAIANVPLVVSFAERVDDFSKQAHFVCPDPHPLESWMDAEPVAGLVSISQPTLHPLGETRSILETLHQWMGQPTTALEAIKSHWQAEVAPRARTKPVSFQSFWDHAVHDGFVEVEYSSVATSPFRFERVTIPENLPTTETMLLSLYSTIGMTDSRHAHNPWLQELPDPVTKVTWDNYVSMSKATADKNGIKEGDIVKVAVPNGPSIELPAYIQRGQHDRVLAIALGYGVPGTDRFADIGPPWLEARPTVDKGKPVGENAARFIRFLEGTLQYSRSDVTLSKTGRRRPLASTQGHHTLEIPRNVAPRGAEVRDVVQETTLAAYRKDPHAGAPAAHHQSSAQLWPDDHPKTEHHWGMTIDPNRCTGCSACLIACQSENNVPVVGKDEVLRQREMHWIRIDRYYSGTDDDLQTAHQPMMCQHCDNAPCETVCPVLATVHSEEGLNHQAYNRCVGTRYCANNCPYKVRRFNWFKYEHDDELQNLALNPDVTVRGRGVMEKCSMCIQRIEVGKLEAKRLGQPVADGTIQTACQQSCPAQAIVFGDLNDTNSRVHNMLDDARSYGVLAEFNFQPSVSYLRVVRNRDDGKTEENLVEGKHHE